MQDTITLLRPSDVCKQLAISSTTLYRLVKSKKLKAPVKVSARAVVFKSKDIENYINSIMGDDKDES